jgi:predicted RNA binding protein with dsRBD fold (UPF0201 family)
MATMTVDLTTNQKQVLKAIKAIYDTKVLESSSKPIITAKCVSKILTDLTVKQLHELIGELHQLGLIVVTNDTANSPKKQITGVSTK